MLPLSFSPSQPFSSMLSSARLRNEQPVATSTRLSVNASAVGFLFLLVCLFIYKSFFFCSKKILLRPRIFWFHSYLPSCVQNCVSERNGIGGSDSKEEMSCAIRRFSSTRRFSPIYHLARTRTGKASATGLADHVQEYRSWIASSMSIKWKIESKRPSLDKQTTKLFLKNKSFVKSRLQNRLRTKTPRCAPGKSHLSRESVDVLSGSSLFVCWLSLGHRTKINEFMSPSIVVGMKSDFFLSAKAKNCSKAKKNFCFSFFANERHTRRTWCMEYN